MTCQSECEEICLSDRVMMHSSRNDLISPIMMLSQPTLSLSLSLLSLSRPLLFLLLFLSHPPHFLVFSNDLYLSPPSPHLPPLPLLHISNHPPLPLFPPLSSLPILLFTFLPHFPLLPHPHLLPISLHSCPVHLEI